VRASSQRETGLREQRGHRDMIPDVT
jgi:hypothetical protein